jgi:ABC-type nitrate/sulfonate/bicarbonate transport system ATPase subunit
MAQRASIARALINNPEVLLLDEPLGALDAMTRLRMQRELEEVWRREGSTTLMVTHDIEEAVYLSDKVVVMSPRPGRIEKSIDIPLPRPRNRSSQNFHLLKDEVLRAFDFNGPSAEYGDQREAK